MGLNQNAERGTRTFVNIVQGNFAKRVEESTHGAKKRIIKDKETGAEKVVWELIYQDIDGMIEGVEIKDGGKFGDQLNINMSDVDEKFTVTLPVNSREAKSFMTCLANIDLQAMVTLAPYNFEAKDDGKKKIGMNIYQGGKTKEDKVPRFFSKEEPNGLPQVEEGADADEFKHTMGAQTIFLKKWTKRFIADTWGNATPTAEQAYEQTHQKNKIIPNLQAQSKSKSDDLPF